MSPKQWLALLCFYFSYLLFGASIFYHVEHDLETQTRQATYESRMTAIELINKYTVDEPEEIQSYVKGNISEYCGKSFLNYTAEELNLPYQWNYYHAFHFAFIACSTIGYGNLVPHTTFGQIFCIFYTLIGIPVNGLLFAYLGDFFGRTFTRAYKRYKDYKLANNKNYVPQQFSLIGQIILYLVPGVVIFIFLPAIWFSFFEDWTYMTSVWYAYITLTTIGFGDYVATFVPTQESEFGIWFIFYEIFVILWLIFGLGYLVMIITFLAKGMQHKKIVRLEHQLSQNIKATQNRIWVGVQKDVGYLRRILNESYIMRFKPVYTESTDRERRYNDNMPRRSSSCPQLVMYRSASPHIARKRAYSEHNVKPLDSETISTLTLNRVQSDTDLSRIDKKKTFEQNNQMLQNGELIARVVTALGSMRPTDEDGHSVLEIGGVHGFSDSQILAGERTASRWSLAPSDGSFAHPPKQRRGRAASDFLGLPVHARTFNEHNEHTWCGNEGPILQQMAARNIARSKNNDLYRAAIQPVRRRLDSGTNPSVMLNVPGASQEPMSRAINQSLINRLNPFRSRKNSESAKSHDGTVDLYLQQTAKGRDSMASMQKQYLDGTAHGRHSVFSVISHTDEANMDLLEKTTIGDLIRALEVVHTKVNTTSDTPLLNNYFDVPKRKLGTASLTPPKVPPLYNLFSPSPENLSRKGSLRPTPGYTTVFSSQAMQPPQRKLSTAMGGTTTPENMPQYSRLRPPPYTARDSPKPTHRKFSVRATNLSIPPGQAPPNQPSVQQSSTLQRRLSVRPSPLTRDTTAQLSGRFTRQATPNNSSGVSAQTAAAATAVRNLLWRPAQLQTDRTRHGSLAELYERNERKRTESK